MMPSPTCPYCREAFAQAEPHSCPACGTPHHDDCWEENGGCTVFGCEHAPADDPKILVAAHEISRPEASPGYFIARNGERQGPFTLEHIREETFRGAIRSDDLVWREGLVGWVPLSHLLASPAQLIPAEESLLPTALRNDPCEGRMRFGRGIYLLSLVAISFVVGALPKSQESKGVELLIFLVFWFPVAALRTRDAGMSGWNVLLTFLPIFNLILHFRLLVAPRGYVITKKPDLFMKIMLWVVCALTVLIAFFAIVGALNK